jgi:hypothetical protein
VTGLRLANSTAQPSGGAGAQGAGAGAAEDGAVSTELGMSARSVGRTVYPSANQVPDSLGNSYEGQEALGLPGERIACDRIDTADTDFGVGEARLAQAVLDLGGQCAMVEVGFCHY